MITAILLTRLVVTKPPQVQKKHFPSRRHYFLKNVSSVTIYSLHEFGLFLFIADHAMFFTVKTTSVALQCTSSFCEVPFFW